MAVDGWPGVVVIDRLLLERPVVELAFVLGRSLEYLRCGCAALSELAFDDRLLLPDFAQRPFARGPNLRLS